MGRQMEAWYLDPPIICVLCGGACVCVPCVRVVLTPLCTGDILGCGLDADRKEIMYWLNGKYMGVAFSDVELRDGLYAGVSIETQVRCTVNFGGEPFKYPPSAPTASASSSPSSMELEPTTTTTTSSSSASSSSCSYR